MKPSSKVPGRVDGAGLYKELVEAMYAVRRLCPHLPLLGASSVNPRYPLSSDHVEMMNTILNGVGEATRSGTDRSTALQNMPPVRLIAKRLVLCMLSALRETLDLIYLKLKFSLVLRRLKRNPASLLMKTWCFGPESLNSSDDFYYGRLPQLLQQRGVSFLLLCGDALGGNKRTFAQAVLKRTQVRSIPEQLLAPVWAPIVIACKQIVTSWQLYRLLRTPSDGKFAVTCARALVDCLSPSTTKNTMYYYIAKGAVETWRPRAFVTLYEGQSWEVPAWNGAKTALKECLTVGYQHTVVMPYSLSLTWPNKGSWELSTPDLVLYLGERTKRMMKPGHEAHKTEFILFGSFRRSPGSSLESAPRPWRRTVLVLPMGSLPEAKLLFNFVIRVASSLLDHQFIFRCHPLVPFEQVRPWLESSPEECRNIEVSDCKSIEDDFSRSSVVLYRSSSAALYAVLNGIKPVYLDDRNLFDVDVLFELTNWRERVSSVSEMEEVLRRYAATGDPGVSEEWRRAAEFVNGYTTAADDASADRFLRRVMGDGRQTL